jgi:hypothetical protein
MTSPPPSDRPMAPSCGFTTSPLLTLASTCAAWWAAQALYRRPHSQSQSHPVQGLPTVSVGDAMSRGKGRTLEPGKGLSEWNQPIPTEPGPLLPWPAGLRSPVISIDPPSSTVQQGQDASFKCLIHEGATPINLEWKTRNQELEGELPGSAGWRQVWGPPGMSIGAEG